MKSKNVEISGKQIFVSWACGVMMMCLVAHTVVLAEDWPTYMYDNARSGVTSESLDLTKLRLNWTHISPFPPRVAWDSGQPWDAFRAIGQVPLRDFDFAFFVTVVGDSVFFGSSVTDSVHCLDIATGEQKWFYRSNGPVRFPPSYYQGKLYFVSDDGYLYCINAQDGSLEWKYTPVGVGDTRLICNNGKLIPMWPSRTGTAIVDGKVYFASSLVSWKNSYLCSVDSLNGTANYVVQGHTRWTGSATSMGAIMASLTKLYVMEGKQTTSVYNRANGSFLTEFSVMGSHALLTSESLIQRCSGTESNTRGVHQVAEITSDAIATHPDARFMVVSGEIAYLATASSLEAVNRTDGQTIWSVSCDYPYCLIKAGNVLFLGNTDKVVAFSDSDGSELWSKVTQGRVYGLAAANDRLVASTDTGNIYVFSETSFLAADFNSDGAVDLLDLFRLVQDYLKCTNPQDSDCEEYLQ